MQLDVTDLAGSKSQSGEDVTKQFIEKATNVLSKKAGGKSAKKAKGAKTETVRPIKKGQQVQMNGSSQKGCCILF